jgi:alkylhydroperoxidase family enzyme
VKAVQTNFRTAKIDAKTYALLDYAEHLEGLRQAGFTEEAILDAVSIMGFFQMANFHADVLGLAVNPEYATMRKVEGLGKV